MGATNNVIGAQFTTGMANLVFPDFTIQHWQIVLVAYLIAFLSTAANIWARPFLHRLSQFILIWNIGSFFVVIIVILSTNNKMQPASFVFQEFENFSGWGRPMAAIIGLLQSAFGMCCYDAPSHLAEEMNAPSRDAPKAIILSVILGAVTGFAFLLALCFCIGDMEQTANTSTGVPVIQIFYDSTGSKVGACFLGGMITVIVIVAGNNLLAEGSRVIYAFARDRGLPFSGIFSKVDKKSKVPIYAVLLTLAAQLALDAIDFGTSNGFETVTSIATEGFYISYAIALGSRILGYFTGHVTTLKGPFSLPPAISISLNVLGLLYLLFTSITFNFPTSYPVDDNNMNYTCAAVGIICIISLITWVTTGRKHFTGPAAAMRMINGSKSGEKDAMAGEKQTGDETEPSFEKAT